MTSRDEDNSISTGTEAENADLFGVAGKFKKKLNACCQNTSDFLKDDIVYLWVRVTAKGLKQGVIGNEQEDKAVSMQHWLNVVDEAASLGANWLVLSIADPLIECEAVWEISRWAQEVHGMTVGLHLKEYKRLTDEEITRIRQLKGDKTRLILRCSPGESLDTSKFQGISVCKANPQADGERPKCQGPTRMIFVNDDGVLYTCGLVAGNNAYRMGHVCDARFDKIIKDRKAPRCACSGIHLISLDCDGCPSLLVNIFAHES